MKKNVFFFTVILLIICFCTEVSASTEQKYVSLHKIRATIPERWVGTYQTKDGRTVSIDVPIIIPDVDKVPIVGFTYGEPFEISKNAKITWNESYGPGNQFVKIQTADSFEDCADDMVAEKLAHMLGEYVPELANTDLGSVVKQGHHVSQKYGFNVIIADFRSHYYGFDYIGSGRYISLVDSEPKFPGGSETSLSFTIEGVEPETFACHISRFKETRIVYEDVPLLSFDSILQIFENWVEDGYVSTLEEIRLSYMGFINPEKVGEEFYLMPVWTAKGNLRYEKGIPFTSESEYKRQKESVGISGELFFPVNAQTGGTYDYVYDKSPKRKYAHEIITWDDVK